MHSQPCDACGGRLPENPWMRSICSSACVDAYADALVNGRTPPVAAPVGLDAFVAVA